MIVASTSTDNAPSARQRLVYLTQLQSNEAFRWLWGHVQAFVERERVAALSEATDESERSKVLARYWGANTILNLPEALERAAKQQLIKEDK
ncbi:MAG: hypothetical protein EBS53_16165 [Bacteroidetes bacterium]|nr:hypothetical protein [Bacteroidota bacterium]